MRNQVQVKGTLPLVASFLNTSEKRIYEIFNLNEKDKSEIKNDMKGETKDGAADKSKTIQSPKDSI